MLTFFDYAAYWPIFPIGLAIATTAMATGIDGAIFWAPVLIFGFKLPPEVAVACGIFIEVFGFGSGVYSYHLKKRILFKQIQKYLYFAMAFGLVGAVVSKALPIYLMYLLLGLSTAYLSYNNIKRSLKKKVNEEEKLASEIENPVIKHSGLGKILNSIGGFLTGVIGVGLGEVNNYFFSEKNKLSIPYASGNGVFLIAITAFVCSIFNIIYFGNKLEPDKLQEIYSIIIFAIPSVMIGARIGSIVAHKAIPKLFYLVVGMLFFLISINSFYKMAL